MKILITGASGYIGSALAHSLADDGHEVHALVRNPGSAKFLNHPGIKVFEGDIMNKDSLMAAMKNCGQVYHTAAKVGAWASDPSVFYDVNVQGTRHVLDAAIACGVTKTVITSSTGVIGPAAEKPLDEESKRSIDFAIDYDRSKKQGEDLALQYASEGMNLVIVSPSKIYGPGHTSHSLTANAIIGTFLHKKYAFVPAPGNYMVCFAFIDDIVKGHVLAMKMGKAGEKFILGGINISYVDFFSRIRELSKSNGRILHVPKSFIKSWAYLQQFNFKLWKTPVRFPVESVDHLYSNYIFSSNKAIQQLGYQITELDEALTRTIEHLRK